MRAPALWRVCFSSPQDSVCRPATESGDLFLLKDVSFPFDFFGTVAFPVFGLANGSLFPLTHSLARSLSSSLSFPLAFLPFLFLSFLKRSLFDFPPFHSFSLHFSRFLNPVLPPAALFIHFTPFFFLFFLSAPPSLFHPLHSACPCMGSVLRLNLLQANPQSQRFPGFEAEWSPAVLVTERFDPLQSRWPQQKTTTVRKQRRHLETRS